MAKSNLRSSLFTKYGGELIDSQFVQLWTINDALQVVRVVIIVQISASSITNPRTVGLDMK